MKRNIDADTGSVRVIYAGHRGYGASQVQSQRTEDVRYPENSLISLKKVMESGAESIEFDIHRSFDNKLMAVHDNDLSINAQYIWQEKDQEKSSENRPLGSRVIINKDATFVHKWKAADLKQKFDISKGMTPDNLSKDEQRLYTEMPELSEILTLVSQENERRRNSQLGLPKVKMNIELKGQGTGYYVQEAINNFNNKQQDERRKIEREDIYYMSFSDAELAAVAGLTDAAAKDPKANLIYGVPTSLQYKGVDNDYNITNPTLNIEQLQKTVVPLDAALKSLSGRDGRGLTGVDMSMWDVSSDTIDYSCKDLKLPIHLAVVPFEKDDFSKEFIGPALSNINKIVEAQREHLIGNHVIMVKTDNPKVLQDTVMIAPELSTATIKSARIRESAKDQAVPSLELSKAEERTQPKQSPITLYSKPSKLQKEAIERAKAIGLDLKLKAVEKAVKKREHSQNPKAIQESPKKGELYF